MTCQSDPDVALKCSSLAVLYAMLLSLLSVGGLSCPLPITTDTSDWRNSDHLGEPTAVHARLYSDKSLQTSSHCAAKYRIDHSKKVATPGWSIIENIY